MKIKQRLGALLAAVLLGLGGAVVLSTPAHAADYLHRVIHSSGLCLEVPNSSMQMNEQLILNVCGPASDSWNQKFWFSDGSLANFYFIRPGHNLWCTVPGVVSLVRSTIVQWGCDWNSYSEQWIQERPVPEGTQYWRLRNATSQLCLSVDEAFVGALVRQSTNCGEGLGGGVSFWTLPYA